MMMFPRRSIAVVASAAVMTSLVTGVYPLSAQESTASKSQAAKTNQTTKVDAPAPGFCQEVHVHWEGGSS